MTEILKLRRLHPLLAVRDTGSTARAAPVVHMTQPAVAAAIAATERDIGETLFERTSRGMTLTRAGSLFCARAEAAVAHLKAAESALRPTAAKSAPPLHRLVSEVQLKALAAVIDSGSFSAAARSLGVSQPNVYRAAQDLETLCGARLWTRRGAAIEATDGARELARLAGLCFRELAAGLAELRELHGVMDGTVAVGALPLASSKWLPDAVAATLQRFPAARFHIVDGPYDEQLSALRSGRIDMVLGALRTPAPFADVVQEAVYDDPLVIVVRGDHPLAPGFDSERDKLTPAQLGGLSWILPRHGTPGRSVFEAFLAAKGLDTPARVVECSSLAAIRALLGATDHAAIVSRQQVEPEIASGLLKIMGPPLTGSLRSIGLTTRRGFRFTQLQDALATELRAAGTRP